MRLGFEANNVSAFEVLMKNNKANLDSDSCDSAVVTVVML